MILAKDGINSSPCSSQSKSLPVICTSLGVGGGALGFGGEALTREGSKSWGRGSHKGRLYKLGEELSQGKDLRVGGGALTREGSKSWGRGSHKGRLYKLGEGLSQGKDLRVGGQYHKRSLNI